MILMLEHLRCTCGAHHGAPWCTSWRTLVHVHGHHGAHPGAPWCTYTATGCTVVHLGGRGAHLGGHFYTPEEEHETIVEVQVASQLIKASRNSINIDTVNTVAYIATEVILSSPNNRSGFRNADLLIVLGNALVMKYLYLGQDGITELDQAIARFQEANSCLSTSHASLKYISTMSLVHVELLRLIEFGEINAYLQSRRYLDEADELDKKGQELTLLGGRMAKATADYTVLGEAIALLTTSLQHRMAPHPRRAQSLCVLGAIRVVRFENHSSFEDLEEGILLHREALNMQPAPHPGRHLSLTNLANALITRFEQKGTFQDLDDCILLNEEALELHLASHPNDNLPLATLADALYARFEHRGEFRDLERSIILSREAVKLQPASQRSSDLLNKLAGSLSTRFRQKGGFQDLEEAIQLNREALSLRSAADPDRHVSLRYLAGTLCTRFEQTGSTEDLEESIILLREALGVQPASHLYRPQDLTSLANSLFSRFNQTGAFGDLEEAAVLGREALRLQPSRHTGHPNILSTLANALYTRFKQKGVFQDLDDAILLNREALNLQSTSHQHRCLLLGNLATALSNRFQRNGAPQDLEECVLLSREALSLRPAPHPGRSNSLDTLARALSTRFERTRAFRDLEEAILFSQEALSLRPATHPERYSALNNLAKDLFTRFQHRGAFQDFEQSILLTREALNLRPAPHPNRLFLLSNLGGALWSFFKHSSACPDGNIALPALVDDLLCNLLPELDCSRDAPVMSIALRFFEAACKYETGSLVARIRSAHHWAVCAQEYRPSLALDAYQYAIELVPLLASLDLTLQERQDVLQHSQALVGDAAKSAMVANRYEMAVMFLCSGRSVFWSQALQLRTPVDELSVTHPRLAERFSSLSRQLEDASFSENRFSPGFTSKISAVQDGYASLYTLADQRRQMIDEIQKIPGFEGFLQPLPFALLQPTARNGPVILLNASKVGCDILIMHGRRPVEHVPLPDIHLGDLTALEVLLSEVMEAGMRAINIPRDVTETLRGLLGRDMLRDSQRNSNEEMLQVVLGYLWTKVVQPVVRALDFTKSDSPTRRIWWCPTGPFASLPIHAAGIYSEDDKIVNYLSQYAVSSYCTSPQDLLHPEPQITEAFKMTAIIDPEAPGAPPLPATLTELREIQKHVPDFQQHLIQHVGSNSTSTSLDEILSDVHRSSLTHFGCHGMQHSNNPLESSLLLSGGRLTMSKIIKECQVPEGALAYLSACETAKGDEVRPNESLNLVATMMFAGFRSVVGTMW